VLHLRSESRLAVYTQCSKCETVFKLSAEVLRAAGGQVRCGNCGEVFNALARLAEDSAAFAPGESSLELEARAESILETVVAPQVAQPVADEFDDFAPPGVEIAQLEVLDWSEENQAPLQDADRSMEFTLPPGELDRIFVESKKRAASALPPTEGLPPAEALAPTEGLPPTEALPPMEVPSPPTDQPTPEGRSEAGQEPEPPRPHPESTLSGFEVSDDVRRDMLAGFDEHIRSGSVLRKPARRGTQRRALLLWISAAIAATLLLLAQVVHQNREWLVGHAHGTFGTAVRALYAALGTPLPQPANLSAYQLRQWGVTGDPDANGTLRVRASILNTAPQLQPYPLLRVALADRFGKRIGTRDFEPGEYLGKPTARMLAPGERVDATLTILDPGKSAEGFEIDVCLRGVDRRISCAGDVAAQTGR
jgi:predicted Zn finger-like uncharacterized protein